ncbi:MAG: methylmalonyl-CoA mutase family protein, partial [Alphaproteobacteria bacterium]|nr:methylmalonyl-CoA mutase family protein [Alphaproteobacteria bacterium]
TDRMDVEITKVIAEIEDYGGAEKAIEDGYLQSRIAKRALERKLQTDAGERVVVGQNHFRREDESASDFGEVFKLDAEASGQTIERFNQVRASRDGAAASESLQRLSDAALRDDENLIPHMIACAHAYVSIGEMVGALKEHWGEFQEPVGL